MVHNVNQTAVFLDRDGTISHEIGYITEPDKFYLYDFSPKAIKRLNSLNVRIIVVTNQACVAKGLCGEDSINAVNGRMINLLNADGAYIDDVFFCPHHVDGTVKEYAIECSCRKPKTGMIAKAVKKYHIEVENSFVVGDKISDVEMGYSAGTQTILVMTGHGRQALDTIRQKKLTLPHYTAENLLEAVDIISRIVMEKIKNDGA